MTFMTKCQQIYSQIPKHGFSRPLTWPGQYNWPTFTKTKNLLIRIVLSRKTCHSDVNVTYWSLRPWIDFFSPSRDNLVGDSGLVELKSGLNMDHFLVSNNFLKFVINLLRDWCSHDRCRRCSASLTWSSCSHFQTRCKDKHRSYINLGKFFKHWSVATFDRFKFLSMRTPDLL